VEWAAVAARQAFERAVRLSPACELWRVLYAGPAPLGVAIGQQRNPTMYPPAQPYEGELPRQVGRQPPLGKQDDPERGLLTPATLHVPITLSPDRPQRIIPLHSSLGDRSPMAYEAAMETVTTEP
jgi:hypothetical protein